MIASTFQREFNSKTIAYQSRYRERDLPVIVEVPDAAHSPAGHTLVCALINLLARAHQRLVLVGNLDEPLLCRDVFGYGTLIGATAGLAAEINPFAHVDVVERLPRSAAITSISVGPGASALQLGCQGWQALTGRQARIVDGESEPWGALLAACLGAWAAFQRLIGERPALADRYSLWEYGRYGKDGPSALGPLNVGTVLQVGVGGVGAALDYWLALVGVGGAWTLVDGDQVEVSNLNRQLLFTAADAGYGGVAQNKAVRAAALLPAPATASPRWYGEDHDIVAGAYDVVLALANERGVRGALQDRRAPILLHATTSASSQAQLHRHIPGLDDCIRCRLPGDAPRLSCSEVRIDARDESDSALPFLSGTAGLLLASSLARLTVGVISDSGRNLHVVDLAGVAPATQSLRSHCRSHCRAAMV